MPKHTVQQGEDYRSIAEANGIWDWWDLVEYNRHVNPETGAFDKEYTNPDALTDKMNPDLLAPGDILFIPEDDDGQEGRQLLAELTGQEPPAKLFGGKGYRSPWGTFSLTIQRPGEKKPAYPEGTLFEFRDVRGETIEFYDQRGKEWRTQGQLHELGGMEVDLPRKRFMLYVQTPGSKAWIRFRERTEAAIREKRTLVPTPEEWPEEQKKLFVDHGVDGLFPHEKQLPDPFTLAFGDFGED